MADDPRSDRKLLLAELDDQARQIVEQRAELIEVLGRIVGGQPGETLAHCRRVGLYSELLALKLGWDADDAENLRYGAQLHDIGKLSIPNGILFKPEALTPLEFEIVKLHASLGHEWLEGLHVLLLRIAADVAWAHHERYDGTGYPRGLVGEGIPMVARIVAVADVFDALMTPRPYRLSAYDLDRALAVLEDGTGSHFDPDVISVFYSCLPDVRRIMYQYPNDRGRK